MRVPVTVTDSMALSCASATEAKLSRKADPATLSRKTFFKRMSIPPLNADAKLILPPPTICKYRREASNCIHARVTRLTHVFEHEVPIYPFVLQKFFMTSSQWCLAYVRLIRKNNAASSKVREVTARQMRCESSIGSEIKYCGLLA